MKKYIEIRALQRDEMGPESQLLEEYWNQALRDDTGSIDSKHYTVTVEYRPGALHLLFKPKDEEECRAHQYYEVVVPVIDIIRGAAEQCRHRFFTEKHKP
jgi:hypothetical protein